MHLPTLIYITTRGKHEEPLEPQELVILVYLKRDLMTVSSLVKRLRESVETQKSIEQCSLARIKLFGCVHTCLPWHQYICTKFNSVMFCFVLCS